MAARSKLESKYEEQMMPSLTEGGQCGTGADVLRAGGRVEEALKLVDWESTVSSRHPL